MQYFAGSCISPFQRLHLVTKSPGQEVTDEIHHLVTESADVQVTLDETQAQKNIGHMGQFLQDRENVCLVSFFS